MIVLYGAPNDDGTHTLPTHSGLAKATKKSAWFARRVFGKILAAIRILNTASTFERRPRLRPTQAKIPLGRNNRSNKIPTQTPGFVVTCVSMETI